MLRRATLKAAEYAGGFSIARALTAASVRVLCYHGFSMTDEHEFRPGQFITTDLFESRLRALARDGFTVLSLKQALTALSDGRVPRNTVVITFDDGFYGTYQRALPLLQERNWPSTIYMTSYYMQHGGLIFRLAVQYMFWKTRAATLRLDDLAGGESGPIALKDAGVRDGLAWRTIRRGEHELDEAGRRALLEELGRRLDVDYPAMLECRGLGLMTADEVRQALAMGADIQLHTHRHRFTSDPTVAEREIQDNRRALEPIVGRPLRHFCYPEGVWAPAVLPILERLGIESATTCESGLNDVNTPAHLMRRFLDGQNIAEVEFRAALAGLPTLARRIMRRDG